MKEVAEKAGFGSLVDEIQALRNSSLNKAQKRKKELEEAQKVVNEAADKMKQMEKEHAAQLQQMSAAKEEFYREQMRQMREDKAAAERKTAELQRQQIEDLEKRANQPQVREEKGGVGKVLSDVATGAIGALLGRRLF